MDPDPQAFERWVARFADPREPLALHVCGHTQMDARWQIPPRRLREHLFYYICKGAVEAQWTGGAQRLDVGSFLWLPPGLEHAFRPGAAAALPLVYHLRITLDRDPALSPTRQAWHVGDARVLHAAFTRLHTEHNLHLPLRASAFRAELVLLLCQIGRLLARGARTGPGLGEVRQRILLSLVAARITRGLRPIDMARALGLTPVHFARAFRRAYGVAPRTWIMRERVRRAADALLESAQSVSAVATAHGWDDPLLFSRQFRQVMGQSPSRWRERSEGERAPTV